MPKLKGGWQSWLAIGTFLLALLFAFMTFSGSVWILALLGLVIGLTAITVKERESFLVAVLAITLVSLGGVFSGFAQAGTFIGAFLTNLAAAFGPAAVLVALIHLYDVSKSK